MDRPAEMKVLLVGDFPPPNGGVATHVEELFRSVRARGGTCEVLDIGKGQLPADGVVPAGGVARFAVLLGSYAARGYQIHLHTSGANPKSWLLASACAVAGLASRVPSILTLHSGLGPAWLEETPGRKVAARMVVRQFGKVIAVSADIRDALLSCGVPAERVEVLPAFSHEFLRPGAPPEGFSALRAEAAPLFCAMVAPRPEYGEKVLLESFAQVRARLPQARLALYGPGSEAVRGEGVRGFGELHRSQALALLAGADVFVRPTLADGDSVSVREALALGRLVVATRVGNRPPEARLVDAGDAGALAGGLLDAAGELAARPVRTVSAPAADSLQRILALYGFCPPATPPGTPAREETAPCAASAAS
jgi:glycosyltransferase involved in cell wall biosynthesis